ncbi:uncharacterized protein BJX67DRAFT_50235 [Aspergillus lucknowensis]|uniref:Uncharacterized protein n=1 Tax=Aspergillus lucknowensis TaxID=176173 RepID=A0ABR4LY11_9EURO
MTIILAGASFMREAGAAGAGRSEEEEVLRREVAAVGCRRHRKTSRTCRVEVEAHQDQEERPEHPYQVQAGDTRDNLHIHRTSVQGEQGHFAVAKEQQLQGHRKHQERHIRNRCRHGPEMPMGQSRLRPGIRNRRGDCHARRVVAREPHRLEEAVVAKVSYHDHRNLDQAQPQYVEAFHHQVQDHRRIILA